MASYTIFQDTMAGTNGTSLTSHPPQLGPATDWLTTGTTAIIESNSAVIGTASSPAQNYIVTGEWGPVQVDFDYSLVDATSELQVYINANSTLTEYIGVQLSAVVGASAMQISDGTYTYTRSFDPPTGTGSHHCTFVWTGRELHTWIDGGYKKDVGANSANPTGTVVAFTLTAPTTNYSTKLSNLRVHGPAQSPLSYPPATYPGNLGQ